MDDEEVDAVGIGESLSSELIATTSSLKTPCGSDRANSARESDERMYSAAQESSSFLMDEPSGVSSHT